MAIDKFVNISLGAGNWWWSVLQVSPYLRINKWVNEVNYFFMFDSGPISIFTIDCWWDSKSRFCWCFVLELPGVDYSHLTVCLCIFCLRKCELLPAFNATVAVFTLGGLRKRNGERRHVLRFFYCTIVVSARDYLMVWCLVWNLGIIYVGSIFLQYHLARLRWKFCSIWDLGIIEGQIGALPACHILPHSWF